LADAVHLISAYDAQWYRVELGARNAVHIHAAVQPESLQVVPSADPRRAHTLVIVEKLWADQHRNAVEHFLAARWRPLRRKHPTARLIVIGGRGMPSSFWTFMGGLPGVELHEWVDRLEDVLAEASIAVFPYSVAVGMKNRVLQCLAARNAVVGSSPSFSGLPVRNGVEAVMADSYADIAAGIDRLLDDPISARTMGEHARRFIAEHFTEDIVGCAWERLYEDVAAGAPVRESYGVSDRRAGI
jgi:glycosyltransferase involved in cell wall biosynthesis